MKVKLSACLVLLGFAFGSVSLFAQSAEINPYAGWFLSGTNASGPGRFFNTQYIGVRGGGYITHNFELGGNWNWTNHFQPNQSNTRAAQAGALGFPQGSVRSNLWEAEYTYNFSNRSFEGHAVRPYIVGSTGAIRTSIHDEDTFVLNVRSVPTNQGERFVPNDVFDNHDTFFTFSYGGGVKALRLWGPMGFFGDVRGRTIPNFFSSATTRPEFSGGLTFSWGEH